MLLRSRPIASYCCCSSCARKMALPVYRDGNDNVLKWLHSKWADSKLGYNLAKAEASAMLQNQKDHEGQETWGMGLDKVPSSKDGPLQVEAQQNVVETQNDIWVDPSPLGWITSMSESAPCFLVHFLFYFESLGILSSKFCFPLASNFSSLDCWCASTVSEGKRPALCSPCQIFFVFSNVAFWGSICFPPACNQLVLVWLPEYTGYFTFTFG